MKKSYFFIFCLLVGFLWVNAQNSLPQRKSISQQINTQHSNLKTTSCIDVIRYPESKLSGLLEVDTFSFNAISAVSQAYHFTGSGSIHGVNAYVLIDLDGVPGNADSISLVVSVYSLINYNANYPNAPGTLIHSDTVDVFDVGFADQNLMFSNPVAVTDSFVLVLELNPLAVPSPLPYYGFTGYGDGNAEKLAWAQYQGFWYNAYTDWASVGGWDSDMLLSPIFEQDFTASFSVDVDTICLGNPVTFTNSTSINTDSMFFTAPYSFNLDLDEMLTVVGLDSNYTHTYSSGGVYQPTLEMIHYGYEGNCVDDSIETVVVLDTAIANFNYNHSGGGNYQFSNLSNNANTYYWDFGDGDTSSLQNPSHVYTTSNNYNVCLTVTGSNGCNSNTFCDLVTFVTNVKGFSDTHKFKIYPIPSNKFFIVQVPKEYKQGIVLLTDIVGKTVGSFAVDNQEEVKILTNEINSGVYFVSVESDGQKVYTQRIIIDKK